MSRPTKLGWWLMMTLAILIVAVTGRYFTLDPEVYFPEQRSVYDANIAVLLTHVAGSAIALLIGPLQFLPQLRTPQRLPFHRRLGRVYLIAVLFGGLSGLFLSTLAYGGLPNRLGFACLAVLWLLFAGIAYVRIRGGDVQGHREWMTRTYALAFAGVMLRLWQVVLIGGVGMSFESSYRLVGWLCWVPNLIVAQLIITRKRGNRLAAQ